VTHADAINYTFRAKRMLRTFHSQVFITLRSKKPGFYLPYLSSRQAHANSAVYWRVKEWYLRLVIILTRFNVIHIRLGTEKNKTQVFSVIHLVIEITWILQPFIVKKVPSISSVQLEKLNQYSGSKIVAFKPSLGLFSTFRKINEPILEFSFHCLCATSTIY
jgi:hypothetical protein